MEDLTFNQIAEELANGLRLAPIVETKKWQSTDANPHALRMRELTHVQIRYGVPFESLTMLADEIMPYLPWADNHFETERVSGSPINPGKTYKEWRYPSSAAEHVDFQFSHSYAERYWPRYAGMTRDGIVFAADTEDHGGDMEPHRGIRHQYGDLMGVIAILARDPATRQAYLPIFYPEDITASLKDERLPCTLGYQFLLRNGKLDIVYHMRSCDFVRHFRDDVYLTIRLLLWVLEIMRTRASRHQTDPEWAGVRVGKLIMNITSLHCFEGDDV